MRSSVPRRTHPSPPPSEPVSAGLSYFPEDPELRHRVRFRPDPDAGEVALATTGGRRRSCRRAGRVRFSLDGTEVALALFAHEGGGLFVPFRDLTSRKETYGGGRYLEVDPPGPDGRVLTDFNDAYNPFCAYNRRWVCPLPPAESHLAVPVRAGERRFEG